MDTLTSELNEDLYQEELSRGLRAASDCEGEGGRRPPVDHHAGDLCRPGFRKGQDAPARVPRRVTPNRAPCPSLVAACADRGAGASGVVRSEGLHCAVPSVAAPRFSRLSSMRPRAGIALPWRIHGHAAFLLGFPCIAILAWWVVCSAFWPLGGCSELPTTHQARGFQLWVGRSHTVVGVCCGVWGWWGACITFNFRTKVSIETSISGQLDPLQIC
jgi:hypothetical protein